MLELFALVVVGLIALAIPCTITGVIVHKNVTRRTAEDYADVAADQADTDRVQAARWEALRAREDAVEDWADRLQAYADSLDARHRRAQPDDDEPDTYDTTVDEPAEPDEGFVGRGRFGYDAPHLHAVYGTEAGHFESPVFDAELAELVDRSRLYSLTDGALYRALTEQALRTPTGTLPAMYVPRSALAAMHQIHAAAARKAGA